MGKKATLLEGLCGHALSFGADCLDVEYDEGSEWVYMRVDNTGVSIASYPRSGADARELLDNLYAVVKKPMRSALNGKVWIIGARVHDSFGEDAFHVTIKPAPELDPAVALRDSQKNRASIWRLYTTTRRSIAGRPPNRTCSMTFRCLRPRFTRWF